MKDSTIVCLTLCLPSCVYSFCYLISCVDFDSANWFNTASWMVFMVITLLCFIVSIVYHFDNFSKVKEAWKNILELE